MRTRNLLTALLAALALVAAGCGDDTGGAKEGPAAAEQGTGSEPKPTLTEEVKEPTPKGETTKPKIAKPTGSPPKELKIEDIKKGTGKAAKSGSQVTVDYVGVAFKTGKQFDASWDNGQTFDFQLGQGMVIPGWDEGVEGMKVGGRRKLTIPPDKAYGAEGQPPDIGPNETLVFVIDLRDVQ